MKKVNQKKLEFKKNVISILKDTVIRGGRRPSDRLCTAECPTMGTCNKSICAYCDPLGV